ncbi:hypothetical protein [Williamsia sterculiae]|uniref:hypothetical protein n=1 Tax=Williamsia sterculiae TaxID=1344003 RepID=UPI000970F60D|nr:hypothetical protein [Williamsia sterculiae]
MDRFGGLAWVVYFVAGEFAAHSDSDLFEEFVECDGDVVWFVDEVFVQDPPVVDQEPGNPARPGAP